MIYFKLFIASLLMGRLPIIFIYGKLYFYVLGL